MPFTSSDTPLHIAAIAGSPTPSARSTALLRAALAQLAPRAASLGEIELRNLPPAALLHGDATDANVALAIAEVAGADLVLVATPIYKAAYSGLLKVFLDLLPQDGLRGKIVLPLATGGSMAHLLALDYTLKPVLGALGARHILDTVFATDSQFETDSRFLRQPNADVIERLERALAPLRPRSAPRRQAEALRVAC